MNDYDLNPLDLPAPWRIDASLADIIPAPFDYRYFGRLPQNPDRYAASILGFGVYNIKTKRFLKPSIGARGRRRYTLNQGKFTRPTRVFYSRLVTALTYGHAPHARSQAHHIDGNPTNDDWRNLRWLSPKANRAVERDRPKQPAHSNKRRTGTLNGRHKLCEADIQKVRKWIADDRAQNKVPSWSFYSGHFGVSTRQLRRIEFGQSWR